MTPADIKAEIETVARHACVKDVTTVYKVHVHAEDAPLTLDQMAELERLGYRPQHCEDMHEGHVFTGRCYVMERDP